MTQVTSNNHSNSNNNNNNNHRTNCQLPLIIRSLGSWYRRRINNSKPKVPSIQKMMSTIIFRIPMKIITTVIHTRSSSSSNNNNNNNNSSSFWYRSCQLSILSKWLNQRENGWSVQTVKVWKTLLVIYRMKLLAWNEELIIYSNKCTIKVYNHRYPIT